MAGDDRFRLFCGLQLPDPALDRLERWQGEELSAGSPACRVVPRQNLHVTLAFLGSRPVSEVPVVADILRAAAQPGRPAELRVVGYRETRNVGMIVLADVDGAATALADDLGGRLEAAGVYRRERRRWLPHVTVLRFREPPRLRPALPEEGNVRSVRCALYRSSLGPGGARYEVLESVSLEAGGR